MACPGSLAMSQGLEDKSSGYADQGTAAHFLASACLELGRHPSEYLGAKILVGASAARDFDGAMWDAHPMEGFAPRGEYVVDTDMASNVGHYVHAVRHQAELGTMLVEQRLPIHAYTGEAGAHGTADAVVITPDGELQIHDLKYGMTPVEAEGNKQLMLYALGALEAYGDLMGFTRVRLFIHQPRAGGTSEWSCEIDALLEFGEKVKERAFHALQILTIEDPAAYYHHLHPSEDACRWCLAKASCPALDKFVTDAVGAEFEDLVSGDSVLPATGRYEPDVLATKMAACNLIEDWIKAVRGAVEAALFAGDTVPGYKLVQGKKGARAWANKDEAEAMLKTMRLKMEEMYDFSLISPTQVEKIFGPKGSAPSVKRWNKLQPLITQKDGQPSVALETDKRPALVINHADDFNDETGDDLS